MSNPLASLKKTRKVPFHSPHSEFEPKRQNVPYRNTLDTSSLYTEDEAKLLEEITFGQKRKTKETTNPFQVQLPDDRPGDVSIQPPPSKHVPTDNDLLSLMTSRLHILEQRVHVQNKDIHDKDKRMRVLEEKLQLYQKAHDSSGPREVHELKQKCLKLQKQVQDMEAFLADYGMVWVGNSDDNDVDEYEDEGTVETDNSDDANIQSDLIRKKSLWKQSSSVASKARRDFKPNYDLILQNVEELNALAGDGVAQIQKTPGGAKLKMPTAIPLTLYGNGIVMFSGPFRPMTDVETQICLQDLMDGYFPSELQSRYPEGVPFQVRDKRDVLFEDKLSSIFHGEGKMLGGDQKPSRLVQSQLVDKSVIAERTAPKDPKKHHKAETSLPGPKLTVEQFLNTLPANVIKDGKVIDIRSSVAGNLQGKDSTKDDVILVETKQTIAARERLQQTESERQPSAKDTTTLRIKSFDSSKTYILKMLTHDKLGEIRTYLSSYLKADAKNCDIVCAFPKKVFDDDNVTLQQCGLVPNATLHLKLRKG